mgnify:CR=1 FL=1
MSKYTVKELWEERYGKAEEIIDYAGRRMLKSACGDPNSRYQPTIDHLRPISKGGRDFAAIKNAVRDDLTKFFYKETKRKPMILPIIMEV